jgi:hypothetical protein
MEAPSDVMVPETLMMGRKPRRGRILSMMILSSGGVMRRSDHSIVSEAIIL